MAIVILAPFKLGALANAVTRPTTSTVDILGGLLICMWNYMGWDNASTIATEVERPQRTYPRAMVVAVCIVAVSYILPVRRHVDDWAYTHRMGNGFLGRYRRTLRRTASAHRRRPRRHDQRLRHVQRAGDELFAAAAGDGAGRHAAGSLRQAAEESRARRGLRSSHSRWAGRCASDWVSPGL